MNTPKVVEPRPPTQVQEAQLGEFIATGAVTLIQARGNPVGFELHVDIGAAHGVLGNSRGVIRTFSSLNTLAGLLRRLGADRFDVAIGDFSTSEPPAPMSEAKKSAAKAATSSRSKSSVTKPKQQTKKNVKGSP
jgi:hypothetical protein